MKVLKFEDAKDMRWVDIVRHYFPDATDNEADFILYEETCFPFDTDQTLNQLSKITKKRFSKIRKGLKEFESRLATKEHNTKRYESKTSS